MSHDNPLLADVELPRFREISVDHVRPAMQAVLDQAKATVATLETLGDAARWDNFVVPLTAVEDRIDRTWAPVSHLNSVADSEAWREAHDECLSWLTDFYTDLGQNEGLFRGFTAVRAQETSLADDPVRRRVVDNALRDFRLGGVALVGEARDRFKVISERLSELGNRFGQNLLDSTDAFVETITDVDQVAGLPASALDLARQESAARGVEGYTFTLKAPSYIPLLTYADSRELRRRFHHAYVTRASAQGPGGDRFDNAGTIDEILALRQEMAGLLGFAHYAEYSLQTKMASSVDAVREFLLDLADRSLPSARAELAELAVFAREHGGPEQLEAHDIAYYAQKQKESLFDLREEELRPWFPLPRVLDGMFQVAGRLFGIQVLPVEEVQTWDEGVQLFQVVDADGEARGRFYVDLYARSRKRGGAWMAECVNRSRIGGVLQRPVAFLVCNFSPPVDGRPSLLTHDEVVTLFHEFGHGLHHMLTRVDEPAVAGINGVAWDAVELPSQFLENWCWEAEALALISAHYESGEPLPGEMLDKLRAGRNFQAAMQMLRQVEFALFDLDLHSLPADARDTPVQTVLDAVRARVSVFAPPSYNRFQNSFSHIFGGGYAAGYYSYKWAEVLAADAFGRFEERGVFDRDTGASFLVNILEPGGTRDAMELFTAFRGRAPDVGALLRQSGLAA